MYALFFRNIQAINVMYIVYSPCVMYTSSSRNINFIALLSKEILLRLIVRYKPDVYIGSRSISLQPKRGS